MSEKRAALLAKIKKTSSIKHTDILTKSKVFKNRHELSVINYPNISIALTGSLKRAYKSGALTIAAPSKHFKTSMALALASEYLAANEDAVLVFFDNEFGSPQSYFEKAGIDPERVMHVPFKTVEDLQHEMSVQLDAFERSDKVIMIIDSLGNAASNKETADALKGDAKVDMTRAKAIKALSRIINHDLVIKDKFLIVISHVYDEQTGTPYKKQIMSGGTGAYYISNDIWFIGRRQDKNKTTKEIEGYQFIIKSEKSRSLKEGSTIPITVSYEKGIHPYSGLFDLAEESGYIVENGKRRNLQLYSPVDKSTGEVYNDLVMTEDEIEFSHDFWKPILAQEGFNDFVEEKYLAFLDPDEDDDNPTEDVDFEDE